MKICARRIGKNLRLRLLTRLRSFLKTIMWPKCEHCGKRQLYKLVDDTKIVCQHCGTLYREIKLPEKETNVSAL